MKVVEIRSDESARQRIRESLDESLLVEAAAGTGKTTELVRRIVAILEHGRATVDQIAAVTFTHKAAGELKLRLRLEIDKRLQATPSAQLEQALAHLEEASIGTIHAFCAQILRERPVEALVDPAFVELDAWQQEKLYERAFRSWFQKRLDEPSPAVRRSLIRPIPGWSRTTPTERLKYAGRQLIEWRDYPAEWLRPEWDRAGEIDGLTARIMETAAKVGGRYQPIKDFAQWVSRHESVRERDYDALEAQLLKLQMDLKEKKSGVEELMFVLSRFQERADADLAAGLREEMLELIDRYEELKWKTGRLDFLDLLIRARNLVRDNEQVREYLKRRFTHLFIDEFQDTDPLQAELLLHLATPNQLFIVGDPKQSIYKFRRADIVFYSQIRKRLESEGVRVVQLSRSFRSVRPIQEFVNNAFESEMNGDERSGQADYVRLEKVADGLEDQPSIVGLPVPRPLGARGFVTKWAINESLPDAVTALVEWLLKQSGWKVRDLKTGEWAPIKEGHICILFRRFTNAGDDVTREYTRGLEARRITHVLVGSKSFHSREEVETLRAALTAVEWPEDELSVYAGLKGSLFAIQDATLLKFRMTIGKLHPMRKIPEDLDAEFAPIAEALAIFAELHRARNRRPAAETVNALLEATRAHASFAMRPAGHQVLANVYRIADLARQYEASGGTSFRGFVEELNHQADRSETSEAPVLEEGAEGVRIMTVHQAKGLEFPIVILADITANIARREPERHVDSAKGLCAMRLADCAPAELTDHQPEELERERAEGVRVAYVAATRARDLLIVPGVKGEEIDGWLGPLNRTINRDDLPWIGINQLRLDVSSPFGLKDEEILSEGDAAKESIANYGKWQEQRSTALAYGMAATTRLFLPSVDSLPPPEARHIEVIQLDREGDRPSGRRFGSLVHATLNDGRIDLHARLLGATLDEHAAAETILDKVKHHPLLASAKRVLREVPITLPLETGEILDGVIDLALFDGKTWTVVDYKTDDADQTKYVRQLQWYVWAMEKLTGSPARGVLLAV